VRRFLLVFPALALALLALAAPARAADDPRFVVETLTDNLELPTGLAVAPDGRIFLLEKAGRVKIWKDGVLYGRPLLDIRDEVNSFVDRGLLGIALDPQFTKNGWLYLSYVYDPPGAARDGAEPRTGRIVRYTVVGDVVRPNSARVILDDYVSITQQHANGSIHFAPDGALFAAFGEGTLSQGVQPLALRAQSLDNLQGKVIRIDALGNGLPDNPFYDPAAPRSARSRIWAYGFRNPFRFRLHPQSGLPYVGDVGWNKYEWLVVAAKGANFGWPCVEGSENTAEYSKMPECAGVTAAAAARKEIVYPHDGAPASITAGDFNTGAHFPADTRGNLFFADYSKFFLRRAVLDEQGRVTTIKDVVANVGEPVDMQFGRDGALYLLSHHSRGFMRVRVKDAPLTSPPPTAAARPAPLIIFGAGDGDTLLPGARVALTTTAAADWSVTAYSGPHGRSGRSLARTTGARIEFTMPTDLGDAGFVEVMLSASSRAGAVDAAHIDLFTPHSDGYIRSWWLLGSRPWFDLDMDALGNEASFMLTPDDKRAWLIRSPTRHIDFLRYISPAPGVFGVLTDKASVYAFVWIDVPEARTGLLGMNSDDGLAAWLNNKEIWRNKVGRNMPDDLRDIDLPPITLKTGRNALLIKVDSRGGDWRFKARVLNPDGSIMRDVQIRTQP
jgi:glucose/arabinose dehydrogenase